MVRKVFGYVLITILFFFIIILSVFKPIKVQGNSMYPNLKDGEWALIDKFTYSITDPKRGDLIIFKLPKYDSEYMIKRVIGLQYESVKIVSGIIYINGNRLNEIYNPSFFQYNFYKRIIPQNHIFVLGDNRKFSIDSRYEDVGFIDKKYIIGKIIFKW